jgi:formylmethanofuran dehydrogenase subunit B
MVSDLAQHLVISHDVQSLEELMKITDNKTTIPEEEKNFAPVPVQIRDIDPIKVEFFRTIEHSLNAYRTDTRLKNIEKILELVKKIDNPKLIKIARETIEKCTKDPNPTIREKALQIKKGLELEN